MDACFDFHQVEGLADEVLGASLQRAQLVAGLGRDHQHGQIAARLDVAQAFHDFEAIHFRHLQVEQDQIVAVLLVQRVHGLRVHGGGDARIAGVAQHLFEQHDVGLLVIDDEDAGVQDLGGLKHGGIPKIKC